MTRTPPRVVLDTNIVLSALVFSQGRVGGLRGEWQQGLFCPLASNATIAELLRVLSYPKFKLAAEAQQELLADYLPYCTVVKMPAKPPKTPPCRDPFDVPFLELAVAGKANYLVTGDQDLLGLTLAKCPIVTPEQLSKALS